MSITSSAGQHDANSTTTTLNIGKPMPSRLVLNLIRRGVAQGCFPWPETAWTRYLRSMQEKGLTATGRTPSEPAVQELPTHDEYGDPLADPVQEVTA